ncbi:MAG: YbhN family protein [Niabella sp.]
MTQKIRPIFRFLFFLGLGLLFVWWSIKDITPNEKQHIFNALKGVKYSIILIGFITILFSHWVRAIRWRLLIEPLGYSPSKSNTFFAVMIGYLANQAVPRLGEVLKCSTLTRYEKIPIDKLLGTVILERLIDAICLLLIFVFTLAIQPDLYNTIMHTFFEGSEGGSFSNLLLLIAVIAGIVIVGIFAWMLIAKKNFSDIRYIIKNIITRVWQGITAIRHLKKRGAFIFYTVLMWFLYTICGYLGFWAFTEMQQYGFTEMFTVLCAGSIGMVATPGGIGAYAFLIQKTMQLYGADSSIALAYGWLMWLVQIAAVLVGGLFSLIALPFKNRNVHTK